MTTDSIDKPRAVRVKRPRRRSVTISSASSLGLSTPLRVGELEQSPVPSFSRPAPLERGGSVVFSPEAHGSACGTVRNEFTVTSNGGGLPLPGPSPYP